MSAETRRRVVGPEAGELIIATAAPRNGVDVKEEDVIDAEYETLLPECLPRASFASSATASDLGYSGLDILRRGGRSLLASWLLAAAMSRALGIRAFRAKPQTR